MENTAILLGKYYSPYLVEVEGEASGWLLASNDMGDLTSLHGLVGKVEKQGQWNFLSCCCEEMPSQEQHRRAKVIFISSPSSVHRSGKSQRCEGASAAASSAGKQRGAMSSELAYIVQDPHPGNSDPHHPHSR